MKVKIQLLVLIIIFLLSSYLIYTYVDSDTKNIITNEEIKFKEEYESLNGKYNENSKKYYSNINIIENSNVEYKTVEEVCDTLTDYVAAGSFGDIAKNVKLLDENIIIKVLWHGSHALLSEYYDGKVFKI